MATQKQMFPITYKPGILRDGSPFQGSYCSRGQWVRFFRGQPQNIGGMKNYVIYQQNQYDFMMLDTLLIIMSSIKQLDVNSIPILSKYDNHEKINISEYTKNGYTILLEECNNKYYIHIKLLNDETNISHKIKQIEELFI